MKGGVAPDAYYSRTSFDHRNKEWMSYGIDRKKHVFVMKDVDNSDLKREKFKYEASAWNGDGV